MRHHSSRLNDFCLTNNPFPSSFPLRFTSTQIYSKWRRRRLLISTFPSRARIQTPRLKCRMFLQRESVCAASVAHILPPAARQPVPQLRSPRSRQPPSKMAIVAIYPVALSAAATSTHPLPPASKPNEPIASPASPASSACRHCARRPLSIYQSAEQGAALRAAETRHCRLRRRRLRPRASLPTFRRRRTSRHRISTPTASPSL